MPILAARVSKAPAQRTAYIDGQCKFEGHVRAEVMPCDLAVPRPVRQRSRLW